MKDLILLVADKNMEYLLKGLLPRIPIIEGTKSFSFDIIVHPYRDAGVYTDSHEFLRSFHNQYTYSMIIFDFEGCGNESSDRTKIELEVEGKLSNNGWQQRNCVIVIAPELEQWVWVNGHHIHNSISWEFDISIYDWLHNNSLKDIKEPKPKRPKEAFEKALIRCNTPRSSSIYYDISNNASYKHCTDKAFIKMKDCLISWFR